MTQFSKKIFSAKAFVKDLGFLLFNIFSIYRIHKNNKLSKAFIEKIMTVVTVVNGCTYCKWFHVRQSLSSGVSKSEVKNLLNLQFEIDTKDNELTALLYAQNYSETNRKPIIQIKNKLQETYNLVTVRDINLILRISTFGNLSGNTFDAFLSRIKGIKVKGSSLFFELVFFILTTPNFLPLLILKKRIL